jgi:hypothetical protein
MWTANPFSEGIPADKPVLKIRDGQARYAWRHACHTMSTLHRLIVEENIQEFYMKFIYVF